MSRRENLSRARNLPKPSDQLKQKRWKVISKRRARAKKKAFILKALGGKCSSCGAFNDLELHHRNMDRQYQRGIVSMSWEFIKRELKEKSVALLCRSENAALQTPEIAV